ncbi:MAG: RNA-binding transcriptional accessory protein [Rubrivivax sp.]|nr:RNA-binding transcriptional accessory protein [Betaproteobacteria bacterium]MBP6319408.1 RNA-binding transcriptional accessory protein [Rubrivivax sp.]MBK7277909.1 RNA-binding transcriptional accessory protein [Betaproteobacteria bacterium]MBK7518124.1 RNA-binding transcriptional accessory protein [Betaproteobacteria bacterium]MBK8104386.1 RNA-binding transcriptional accessory protein [Betaproteobacteria bacterium]
MDKIVLQIAAELKVRPAQVNTAVELLDAGSTVPFIARYRKEATEGLDDIQLRELEARLAYLRELEDRRATVLRSIEEQGKLTPELRGAIEAAPTKQELEDLYLPYKPRRRTKGMIAREAGLEPLADRLFADPGLEPLAEATAFIAAYPGGPGALAEAGFADAHAVLDGVRDLLAERWAEDAALVGQLREWLWAEARLLSKLVEGKDGQHPDAAKFRDYFDYAEPIRNVPSHRALAVFRGRTQEWLDARLVLDEETVPGKPGLAEGRIARHLGWSHSKRAGDELIRKTIAWTWKVKLSLSLERDLFGRLREAAEAVAIKVFADNLRDLLLAAPAGKRVVMGLDPGIRTGVKVAVVSDTGRVLDTATVYPHEPRCDWEGSLQSLGRLVATHGVNLIAIGNGTASRETDKLAADLIKRIQPLAPDVKLDKIVVSEAGASVYSASEFASRELPDLDVSLRGAVSIARRLQDPLAELVKIDPKSIGVGQYQHDVNQSGLARSLDAVVEDCVNAVGVDLNTASAPLLARVSGLSPAVAASIVRWRDAHGAFRSRRQLLDVTGLGPKTFEQAAGFLRIRDGDDPLDMTGVHPETYPVVQKLLAATGRPVQELMGRAEVLRTLKPETIARELADERFGAITVKDILAELEKPGRDPRPDFKVARFNDSVTDLKDLQPGMVLEGTVSNVAQFGAFVDLGVHQDGLVHVSQMSHKFVSDAREVVKTGVVVKVRVLEVDLARKRISLTMKLDVPLPAAPEGGADNRYRPAARQERSRAAEPAATGASAMAAAFARLQGRR